MDTNPAMTALRKTAAPRGHDRPQTSPRLADLRAAGHAARIAPANTDDTVTGLVLALNHALGRRMTFHETGAAQLSFDEAWLLNLFDAVRAADGDRYRFALLSRMSRERASALHFLVCKMAHGLDAGRSSATLCSSQPPPAPTVNEG